MSPGGENEYKKPSVTRENYDAVVAAKKERDENLVETESGESQNCTTRTIVITIVIKTIKFVVYVGGGGSGGFLSFQFFLCDIMFKNIFALKSARDACWRSLCGNK